MGLGLWLVVGHKIPGAVDGVWTLDRTAEYIRLLGPLGEGGEQCDGYVE